MWHLFLRTTLLEMLVVTTIKYIKSCQNCSFGTKCKWKIAIPTQSEVIYIHLDFFGICQGGKFILCTYQPVPINQICDFVKVLKRNVFHRNSKRCPMQNLKAVSLFYLSRITKNSMYTASWYHFFNTICGSYKPLPIYENVTHLDS